ncbi:glutathione hydrolase 6, partial [Rhinophrynus dorsalis]
PAPVVVTRAHYQQTCLRVISSILLLAVAVGFVLYELEFRSPESPQHGPAGSIETGDPQTQHPLQDGRGQQKEAEGHHHPDTQRSDHEGHHHETGEPPDLSTVGHTHVSGTYHHAVAVTDSDICSHAAKQVLQSEGSVVDAGIAAALCLAVVHPHTTSLGGVFSSIYYEGTTSNCSVLNAVPSETSHTTYGIPLMLQGLRLLHQRYGRMKWADLLQPAITLANQGFLVDVLLAQALETNQHVVLSSAGLCTLFCDSKSSVKGSGSLVRNPKLGELLEQVSTAMLDSVLPDILIQNLSSDIDATEREKFTNAISRRHLEIEDPLTVPLTGMTLYTPGGPTAGKILSDSIREIFQRKPISENENAPISMDGDFQLLFNISKIMYINNGAIPRSSNTTSSLKPHPPWSPASVGSNVIIADASGDVFAMSLSLNSSFGSGFVSPSTGILLSNFIQVSEVPSASSPLFWACPSVVSIGTDGDVMGLVATGGSSVPFSLTRVIFNHQNLQRNLTDSVRGHQVDLTSEDSTWPTYFGLEETQSGPRDYPLTTVVVEVESEHVYVAKSLGPCCLYEGF